MSTIGRFLRHSFIAGILVIVPVGVTYLILKLVFTAVDSILAPYIETYVGIDVPGLGVAATIVIVFLVGLVATNVFGKTLLNYFHRAVARIPIIGGVYVSARQVIEALGTADPKAFKRVVFIEYPRRGLFTLAFVTKDPYTITDNAGIETRVVNLFVPTTPNPTSGFFILCNAANVIPANLTVEQGIKLVVSGGIITPVETGLIETSEALRREDSPVNTER